MEQSGPGACLHPTASGDIRTQERVPIACVVICLVSCVTCHLACVSGHVHIWYISVAIKRLIITHGNVQIEESSWPLDEIKLRKSTGNGGTSCGAILPKGFLFMGRSILCHHNISNHLQTMGLDLV